MVPADQPVALPSGTQWRNRSVPAFQLLLEASARLLVAALEDGLRGGFRGLRPLQVDHHDGIVGHGTHFGRRAAGLYGRHDSIDVDVFLGAGSARVPRLAALQSLAGRRRVRHDAAGRGPAAVFDSEADRRRHRLRPRCGMEKRWGGGGNFC